MTPDEFESAIKNEDFGKKWFEKEMGGTNKLNYLNELRKLSERHGSRSSISPSFSFFYIKYILPFII